MPKAKTDGEQKLIRYIVTNAEGKRNADAKDPEDVRVSIVGTITANGKDRKTGRLNLTVEQMSRKGFSMKPDNDNRTVEITLPSNRAGRKALSGTNLNALLGQLNQSVSRILLVASFLIMHNQIKTLPVIREGFLMRKILRLMLYYKKMGLEIMSFQNVLARSPSDIYSKNTGVVFTSFQNLLVRENCREKNCGVSRNTHLDLLTPELVKCLYHLAEKLVGDRHKQKDWRYNQST